MLTGFPEKLTSSKDIYLPNEEEPSFDAGQSYSVIGFDPEMNAYIVLSEWGDIQAVSADDDRFEKKGIVSSYRNCSFMYEGASVNNRWIWEKKKQPF